MHQRSPSAMRNNVADTTVKASRGLLASKKHDFQKTLMLSPGSLLPPIACRPFQGKFTCRRRKCCWEEVRVGCTGRRALPGLAAGGSDFTCTPPMTDLCKMVSILGFNTCNSGMQSHGTFSFCRYYAPWQLQVPLLPHLAAMR